MTDHQASFKDFTFGYSSAEEEAAAYSELLIGGFYDIHDVTKGLLSSNPFLVLGYKGSGKSAVGQHLQLISKSRHDLFVSTVHLEDLPFGQLSKMAGPDAINDPGGSVIWGWIILNYLLQSFKQDDSAPSSSDPIFFGTVSELERIGVLPSESVPKLVNVTTRKAVSLTLPAFLGGSAEKETKAQLREDFPLIVDHLRSVVVGFETNNEHVLVIDGLDDLIVDLESKLVLLGGLVSAVARTNNALRVSNHAPAKVILLCRTDLYTALPGANTNKLAQDSGIRLDWYESPRQARATSLVKVAQQKASVGLNGADADIFSLLPQRVRGKSILPFLLDHTRYTPRDFLRVLSYIQNFAPDVGPLSVDNVLSGVRSYSINYFIDEIRNELSGFVDSETVNHGFEAISSLNSIDFKVGELIQKAGYGAEADKLKMRRFAKQLFEVGAIGMKGDSVDGQPFYWFKYRNRESTFSTTRTARLHPGLWGALNIQREKAAPIEAGRKAQSRNRRGPGEPSRRRGR